MVESALERMREGVFGQCVSCGDEINPKRLEAVPWTRYCIQCQEKMEQGGSSTPRADAVPIPHRRTAAPSGGCSFFEPRRGLGYPKYADWASRTGL